jgi:tRNA(Ile)-lysidine synthase TilS/MesJ
MTSFTRRIIWSAPIFSSANSDSRPRGRSTLTIAFNDHCDALVATIVTGHNRPAELEPVVLEFLNGDTVIYWAEVTLGL